MTNANDTAIPQPYQSEPGGLLFYDVHQGLTKREYFAGLVMGGFAADPQISGDKATLATSAVEWADALIDALNEGAK